MIDTRCGLRCEGCSFKLSHNCGGCIATNGHPFHGACPVALCCQQKNLTHCGQCQRRSAKERCASKYRQSLPARAYINPTDVLP